MNEEFILTANEGMAPVIADLFLMMLLAFAIGLLLRVPSAVMERKRAGRWQFVFTPLLLSGVFFVASFTILMLLPMLMLESWPAAFLVSILPLVTGIFLGWSIQKRTEE
ncbi:hypothetical protein [Salsuginibacillus kocurii]|uniref:hypothetical protein n=1 Tax=Salsuginibacillus kocurii TaxID=427078 RepID=UPI000382E373|nr:hypothetical protein [Salsuginibacillus kocurii]